MQPTAFTASRSNFISVLAALGLACSSAHADVITAGSDYLSTVSTGTVFMGVNWEGVPVAPDGYDTVMNRLGDINLVPDSSTNIDLQIALLQLKSVVPFDPDGDGPAPNDYYFVTLDIGPQPVGSMTLNIGAGAGPSNWFGTVDSAFWVNFQVHMGTIDGTVVVSNQNCYLESLGIEWYWNDPSTGWADGITFKEKGTWYTTHDTSHEAIVIPEPNALLLAGAGAVILRAFVRRRRLVVR